MGLADWHHVGSIEKFAYLDLVVNGPLYMGSHVTRERAFSSSFSCMILFAHGSSLDNAQITHRAIAQAVAASWIGGLHRRRAYRGSQTELARRGCSRRPPERHPYAAREELSTRRLMAGSASAA